MDFKNLASGFNAFIAILSILNYNSFEKGVV